MKGYFLTILPLTYLKSTDEVCLAFHQHRTEACLLSAWILSAGQSVLAFLRAGEEPHVPGASAALRVWKESPQQRFSWCAPAELQQLRSFFPWWHLSCSVTGGMSPAKGVLNPDCCLWHNLLCMQVLRSLKGQVRQKGIATHVPLHKLRICPGFMSFSEEL